MAIKNYKRCSFTDVNGHTSYQFPEFVDMVTVIVDMPNYTVAPKMRRAFCRCGWVDSFENIMEVKCPNCGNTPTYKFIQNYSTFELPMFERAYIDQNSILYPVYSIMFDDVNKEVQVIESSHLLLKKDVTNEATWIDYRFLYNLKSCDNPKTTKFINHLIETLMENNPIWDEANRLWRVVFSIAERNENLSKLDISKRIWLYNTLTSLPWCRNEEYLAALAAIKADLGQVFLTEDDFLEHFEYPKFLADLYPLFGFMIDPIKALDNLNEPLKNAIRTAIIHRHIEINNVGQVLYFGYHYRAKDTESVSAINNLGADFPEFFRKNVIWLERNIVDAYKMLNGSSSIKEYNYSKLKEYLVQKKRIKPNRIQELDECFASGDMLQFIKLLG